MSKEERRRCKGYSPKGGTKQICGAADFRQRQRVCGLRVNGAESSHWRYESLASSLD